MEIPPSSGSGEGLRSVDPASRGEGLVADNQAAKIDPTPGASVTHRGVPPCNMVSRGLVTSSDGGSTVGEPETSVIRPEMAVSVPNPTRAESREASGLAESQVSDMEPDFN